MIKRIGILSLFVCAYTLFMMHNMMPHAHEHQHISDHHDYSHHDHDHSDKSHDSDEPLVDHSEAFGVAIVKSDDAVFAKYHEQSLHTDLLTPLHANDILVFVCPSDKLSTSNHPRLHSRSFNAPKSLRAPPACFLL